MKKLLLLLAFIPALSIAQLPMQGFEGDWSPIPAAEGTSSDWLFAENDIGLFIQWEQQENLDNLLPAYEGDFLAFLERENVTEGTFTEDYLLTPEFTVPESAVLRFYSRLTTPGDQGSIYKVLILPGDEDPANIGDYILLQEWTEEQINPEPLLYEEKLVPIPTEYTGSTVRLIFCMVGDNYDRWLIDNVSVGDECVAPFNASVVSDDTVDGAVFSWETFANTPQNWEIVIVSQGSEPVAAPIEVTEMPYEFPDISEGMYDFYIRTVCTPEMKSVWAGPLSFTIGEQTPNTISGIVTYDANNDDIAGVGDAPMPYTEVIITVNDEQQSAYTNADGEYKLYNIPTGENIVSVESVAPLGFTALTSLTQTVNFTEGFNHQVNFTYGFPEPVFDLSIVFTPANEARPGFEAGYYITVINNGTADVAEAIISVSFDDNRLDLINPGDYIQDGSTFTFTVENLPALASHTEYVTFQCLPPDTNVGGEELKFSAYVDVEGDIAPQDNLAMLNQIIVNSFDPNDIRVHEGAYIMEEQADDFLTYTIRFQNTGTASAINIRLENDLDEKLDWETFQPLVSSHSYTVSRNENRLTFRYDNIFLADSTSNEPASHGFVTYKIKPKPGFGLGQVISNGAGIYFDFNPAVLTNIATTEVVSLAGLHDNRKVVAVVYPNPVTDRLYINSIGGDLRSVEVYDVNGRQYHIRFRDGYIDTGNLSDGVYLIKVTSSIGSQTFKVLKK